LIVRREGCGIRGEASEGHSSPASDLRDRLVRLSPRHHRCTAPLPSQWPTCSRRSSPALHNGFPPFECWLRGPHAVRVGRIPKSPQSDQFLAAIPASAPRYVLYSVHTPAATLPERRPSDQIAFPSDRIAFPSDQIAFPTDQIAELFCFSIQSLWCFGALH